MASVNFTENALWGLTPGLAERCEAEIRDAAGDLPGAGSVGCRIRVEEGNARPQIAIQFVRGGWGARFVLPLQAAAGEVRLTCERVLRDCEHATL